MSDTATEHDRLPHCSAAWDLMQRSGRGAMAVHEVHYMRRVYRQQLTGGRVIAGARIQRRCACSVILACRQPAAHAVQSPAPLVRSSSFRYMKSLCKCVLSPLEWECLLALPVMNILSESTIKGGRPVRRRKPSTALRLRAEIELLNSITRFVCVNCRSWVASPADMVAMSTAGDLSKTTSGSAERLLETSIRG